MTPYSNSSFDEHHWVIQIRRTLEEDLEDAAEVPVCIFTVPKTLMGTKQYCYIPQQVAIGPYHYWRPELYDMERYKIAATKKIQKHLQNLKFENLVDQLMKQEPRIRACYHTYLLDINNGETLAWMVAIDGCFLLEFLHLYAIKEAKLLPTTLSRMSHLIDYAGRKSAHNVILRDLVMLENQIPLFILRKILEIQYSSLDAADASLHSMLMGFCKELSPFKIMEDIPSIKVEDSAHLLDFLFHIIVPKIKQQAQIIEAREDQTAPARNPSDVKKLFNEIWKLISKAIKVPISFIKRALLSRPVQFLFNLPWKIITRIPLFLVLKEAVQYFFFSEAKKETKPGNNGNKPPLLEEFSIPSASKLYKSGIRFAATRGGITTISFDVKTFTLHLPSVSLDVNTEVILRNLVAYESSNASGPLVFTRYVEFMNGIIDTKEDVKLLRKKGTVLNHLKSDQEVADLWNGMNKTVRLTKVPFLDKVIEDVNKCYSGTWKVKAKKLLKIYVFGSWQILILLAAILLLFLMGVQTFCSVHSCGRILDTTIATTTE